MNSKDIIKRYDEYVLGTYSRFPLVLSHGDGARIFDADGKQYIDFASGIGVNSVGYANPKWMDAITAQVQKLGHVSNLYYLEIVADLAETLCTRAGMAKAFFANSGAESNEGLIKLARKYSYDKYGSNRATIITLRQSFHGRTLATITATGQNAFHDYFFPFMPGFRHALANDINSVKRAAGADTCAILIEPIQGEGGVLPLDTAFVQDIARLCKERDLLLLADEVQTGIGRTGSLFAYQQYGIEPDAVSFAKGIAGGVPFGGFLTNETCSNTLVPGTHATTFGGNPIGAAAALAVLEILDDAMLADINRRGANIRKRVESIGNPHITGTRGMGLMIGIALQGINHKELAAKLTDAGLLALTAGNDAVRFLPPLTISDEEIDAGLAIFESVLKLMS